MVERQQGGMYPMDASITEMGLDKIEIGMLTEKARKLTKRDLVVLRETAKEFRAQGEDKVVEVFDQRTKLDLRVGDLSSVAHAFDDLQDRLNATPQLAAAAACCCCTCCPCCSCTASVVIEATH
ncbi:hypothetical protein [uncultured Tateyamaria sp.]|uniref:hypothetical protein n=1 Tax=uncultured Tateyamaria sp. TaxID=455651 RepID=UPI002601B19F|nr:hypothetical protein [uncultured Tateyamaria sp.]